MRIVGFHGPEGSGKTTAARALVSLGWEERNFAGSVKNMLDTLLADLGVPSDDRVAYLYGDKKGRPIPELGGTSARYALRTLGTEWGRARIWSDLWVYTELKSLADGDYVFGDVRFDNEADAIKRMGGTVYRIVRPGKSFSCQHISDQPLDNCEMIFNECRTPEEWAEKVKRLVAL